MIFRELNEQEYVKFAVAHPYVSFQQSVPMMEVKHLEGKETCYLGVEKEHQIVAACAFTKNPTLKVMNFLYANRGILMDYEDEELLAFYLSELKKYARKNQALYCRIDPNVQLRQRDINGEIVADGFDHHDIVDKMIRHGCFYCGETIDFSIYSQVRFMFVLDLMNKDEETLLKEMNSRTRWSIHKAEKMGVQVRELPIEEFDEYKKIMDHTSKRKGFSDRDLDYYIYMKKAFKEDFKCLVAEINPVQLRKHFAKEKEALMQEHESLLQKESCTKKQKQRIKDLEEAMDVADRRMSETNELFPTDKTQILAGATFVTYGDEVVYFTAGSYEPYMHYNGLFAIHWEMLRWALDHGYKRYNFYGMSGDFRKEAADYGVYEFKKGFNGTVEEYIGDFILPTNPLFKIYNKIRKIV